VNGKGNSQPPTKRGAVLRACFWLTIALALVYPAFAAFGYWRAGETGLAAASVAGAVCWLGTLAALLLTGLLQGELAIQGVLSGMAFRFGLPFLAGILLTKNGGPLAEAGVFGMIVVYYLFGLLVETLLSVRLVNGVTGSAARA
jgi:hypothetical protein